MRGSRRSPLRSILVALLDELLDLAGDARDETFQRSDRFGQAMPDVLRRGLDRLSRNPQRTFVETRSAMRHIAAQDRGRLSTLSAVHVFSLYAGNVQRFANPSELLTLEGDN